MRSRSQHLSEAGKKKFLGGVKRNLRFSQIYFFSRWFILLLTRWNDASEISNSPFFCLFRGETCRQWRWDFCSHVATYSLCFKWRDAAPDWLIIKQNRLALTHAVVCVCVCVCVAQKERQSARAWQEDNADHPHYPFTANCHVTRFAYWIYSLSFTAVCDHEHLTLLARTSGGKQLTWVT